MNYGAWNVSSTDVLIIIFFPRIKSGPKVVTKCVTGAGVSWCHGCRNACGKGERKGHCRHGDPPRVSIGVRLPSRCKATCSRTGVCCIHHYCCATSTRIVAVGILRLPWRCRLRCDFAAVRAHAAGETFKISTNILILLLDRKVESNSPIMKAIFSTF